MKTIYTLLFCLFGVSALFAQVDSLENQLDTIFVSSYKLQEFSAGQTISHLSDSVIKENQPLLTSLLEYNTPIYFKQNGLGMASSPSFRGTTASQTAVLWNGININSNFLGQTDFNTVNGGNFDDIDVRAGGGSLIYGSGAIGGTVHLNTDLEYKNEISHEIYTGYGSFQTFDNRYKLNISTDKFSFRFAGTHNSSNNDYHLQLREGRNTNGRFRNVSINTALGYKINHNNELRWFNEVFQSNRHFPIYYASEKHTKYKDFNTRSLLEWEKHFSRFTSTLKAGFLTENYNYYPNTQKDEYTYGKAETLIGKYDLSFKPLNNLLLNGLVDYEHTNGNGSDVAHEIRNITSFGFLMKHQLSDKLKYQAGIRKEVTQTYESPLLYSLGLDYQFTSFYTAKLSASKNFRRPTFNDLYWTNSGNSDLKAEESNQIELGNQFSYKNLDLTLTGYFNDITQMIHWLPTSGGLFKPVNEDHVQTYGAEALLNWKKSINRHHFNLNGTYAYTVSKDKESKKQLIYVPYHKATFSAAYQIDKFSIDYQLLYNGEVYLRTDNNPNHILKDYFISNIGAAYRLGKNQDYKIGVRVRNIFDKAYQNVQRYELPGINFNFYINFKF